MAGDWENERRKVAYGAARTVIDHQLSIVSDIDDKAVRTVRVTVLLLGILATGVEVAGLFASDGRLLAAGGLSQFASLAAGMVTYGESDLYLGPSRESVERLVSDQIHGQRWDEDLIRSFSYWIERNHADIRFNGWMLTVTRGALALGVAPIGVAVIIYRLTDLLFDDGGGFRYASG